MNDAVLFDSRWSGVHGIGRHASELERRIPAEWIRFGEGIGNPSSPIDPLRLVANPAYRAGSIYVSPGYSIGFRGAFTRACPTIHDLIHLRFPNGAGHAKALYLRHHLRPAVRNSPVVFTVSATTRAMLVEYSSIDPARVVVTGNGISDSFLPAGVSTANGRRRILALCSPRAHKATWLLAAALSQDTPLEAEVRLVGDATREARKQFAATSLPVTFLGQISEEQLAAEYRASSIFVSTSLEEGFNLPIVEAIASGTRVLASDIAVHREISQGISTITYFEPGSPEALSVALNRVLNDESTSTQLLAESAKAIRQMHSWDDAARRLVEAIGQVEGADS